MKKVLAVLLAVVMAFSVVAVSAAAEETGATYKLSEMPRIAQASPDGEVAILKAGDEIEIGELTANTKTLRVYYYPDAAAIPASSRKNVDWKDVKVPRYNLDTTKWVVDAKKGETVDDFMAKSPNYYKSFYTTTDFVKGDTLTFTIADLGDVAMSRDSVPMDRGEAPIDFALDGAKFLGWVMLKASSYATATSSKEGSIELYALWDRDAAPDPVEPDGPGYEESDDPVINAMNKVLYYIGVASGWIRAVPALLNAALAMILNTGVRNWLYGIFGIEA
ncbi:MAG: hypothetical protein ACI4I5_10665 [Acutalibacteraceae bacterium]